MQNLAIIGSGNIAPFHILAAQAAGFNVTGISGSDYSESARDLSIEHGIPYYFKKTRELLDSNVFDCIALLVPPSVAPELIKEIVKINVPAIIEKPGALSSGALTNFLGNNNIFFGFNRRFYQTIKDLVEVNLYQDGLFFFTAAESIDSNLATFDKIEYQILTNTVHILDLIKFIIGDFDLQNFAYSPINNILRSRIFQKHSYKGELEISFNSKKNTGVEFENEKLNISIRPLEYSQKYDSLETISPRANFPVKRYVPTWKQGKNSNKITESGIFKPGFFLQYIDFFNHCNFSHQKTNLATVSDAQFALGKSELLISEYRKYLT